VNPIMTGGSHQTSEVNVTQLIDDGPLSRFQIGVIVCCALVSALDGIDTQSIGVAAPFIADGLGIKIADFGPIFSAALLGATIGAATFGPLADRLGRKTLLMVAAVLFGVFTILTAFANSVPTLYAFRLLAGLGLGGATPCFIALTSEYTPARLRAALVTLMWSAFPLGAMLGGLLNSRLIEELGWRAIFYIGGVAPAHFRLSWTRSSCPASPFAIYLLKAAHLARCCYGCRFSWASASSRSPCCGRPLCCGLMVFRPPIPLLSSPSTVWAGSLDNRRPAG
jgi:MFS family permease